MTGSNTPVHDAFGLTYASYFVMPRVMLEAMPVHWQRRFVDLFDEFSRTFPGYPDPDYAVFVRGARGRLRLEDERMRSYRHPDVAYVNAMRESQYGDTNA